MLPLLGFASTKAGALLGLQFQLITVEVASRRGPAFFQLAGLAETAVREARIRISSALSRLGVTLEEYALTMNLAPANVRKSGSGLDLAIALAVLGAVGHVDGQKMNHDIFLGELALDGTVRGIPGILPLLQGAKDCGLTRAFVPSDVAREAAHVEGIVIHPVQTLPQLLAHLRGQKPIAPLPSQAFVPGVHRDWDLSDVRGQEAAKRAIVVAAAGHHHLLLVGPPGSGKSLLARRIPGILPPMTSQQALETTAIHSIAGLLDARTGVIGAPPFRAPHHTVTDVGLIGGGAIPRPGELSLAHHGVLFLDELPEFKRSTLEALRQPLEDRAVQVVRSLRRTRFPADPLVVAAMNPCPCGNWGSARIVCRCRREMRARYLNRISGPLLDRIDLHVLVPAVDLKSWSSKSTSHSMSTAEARTLVMKARALQMGRLAQGTVSARNNSELTLDALEKVARPDTEGKKLLEKAIERNLLSARGYVRVLRIARTLADLAQAEQPTVAHIGEALRYRLSDLSEI